MSFNVKIEMPDHLPVLEKIFETNMTLADLEMIVQRLAAVAMESLVGDLQNHVRSGETLASIEVWAAERSANSVSYAMGTRTRGSQLFWLDQGRGAVAPVKARSLRWVSREGMLIFSMYSRPTEALGIMRRAGLDALSQEQTIIESVKGAKIP